MLSKMNAELKKQFAAVFAVGSVFPFFAFCLSAGCHARIRPSEIRTGR